MCGHFAVRGTVYLIYSFGVFWGFFPVPVLCRGTISKMADQVIQAGFANIIVDFFWISGQLKQGSFGPYH